METLYEMLSSERRRAALGVLADADEPLDRTELARRLVARRRRQSPRADGRSPGDVESVVISLGHVHLPKLEEGGLITRFGDGRYVVTTLGADVERAARAFERRLGDSASAVDGDPGTLGGDPGTLGGGRRPVTANDDAEDR